MSKQPLTLTSPRPRALAVVRRGEQASRARLSSLALASDLELVCVPPRQVRTLDLSTFAIAFVVVVASADWNVVGALASNIDTIVFVSQAGVGDATYALGAGAVGYVALSLPDATLTKAIAAIRSGEAGFSRAAIGEWLRSTRPYSRSDDPELPRRQREILDRIARGQTDKQIAHELGLATTTVRKHVQRMLARLRAPNRAAAVMRDSSRARQRGTSTGF